jgi:hypothetical protein
MYVCSNNSVLVIDCNTNTFVTSITLSLTAQTYSISYNSSINSIYVCDFNGSIVYRINCNTNTIVAFQSLTLTDNPVIVRYNNITNSVYVFCNGNPVAYELNPITLGIINTIVIPEIAKNTGAAAFVTVNNSIYYQNVFNNIRQFFCSTNTINPTVIPFTSSTLSIKFNPINVLIYIPDYSAIIDNIKIYTPSTNNLIDSISTNVLNTNDGCLVHQSIKNSVYSVNSPYNNIPNTYQVLEISNSNFYITGSQNYNNFLQDIQLNPMMIRRIDLISDNQNQIFEPFNIIKRDANGNKCNFIKLPNIEVSKFQFHSNIASIDFDYKELILDNNTIFSQYTFKKKSKTTMILYYKQISRIDIVTKETQESPRHL